MSKVSKLVLKKMVKAKRKNRNNPFQLSASEALTSMGKNPSTDFEDQRVRVLGQQNQDLYFQLKEARKQIEQLRQSVPSNPPSSAQTFILNNIAQERQRQDEKFGVQNHEDLLWLAIAAEEFGECAKEVIEQAHKKNLDMELIQLAAVCVAWVECRQKRLDKVS